MFFFHVGMLNHIENIIIDTITQPKWLAKLDEMSGAKTCNKKLMTNPISDITICGHNKKNSMIKRKAMALEQQENISPFKALKSVVQQHMLKGDSVGVYAALFHLHMLVILSLVVIFILLQFIIFKGGGKNHKAHHHM
ncbi:hypothetical protein ACJX0J_037097, partial [Zea mays]